ncbi:MAG TPA: hypothetical protein VEK07_13600, partial [Polyangiaceae bacterium]|nr:hypothetical protein [Polyangiaceae bacterium]
MGGIVCFVGLGPLDPRLRTARAAARLSEADAVLEGDVPVQQLIERAQSGQRVVRTVPGDPFESAAVVAEA